MVILKIKKPRPSPATTTTTQPKYLPPEVISITLTLAVEAAVEDDLADAKKSSTVSSCRGFAARTASGYSMSCAIQRRCRLSDPYKHHTLIRRSNPFLQPLLVSSTVKEEIERIYGRLYPRYLSSGRVRFKGLHTERTFRPPCGTIEPSVKHVENRGLGSLEGHRETPVRSQGVGGRRKRQMVLYP
jgi:hypothetical protein